MTTIGFVKDLILFIAVIIFTGSYLTRVWQVWWQMFDSQRIAVQCAKKEGGD